MRGLIFLGLIVFTVCNFGCGYRLGYEPRTLPGSFKRVSIPVFKNLTHEVGIEPYFTNALIRQFTRSHVAKLTPKSLAPVVLQGEILEVTLAPTVEKSSQELTTLPENSVLITQYRMEVKIRLQLVRSSDKKIIWQELFVRGRTYSAPQIASSSINSANPLYNQSAKHDNIRLVAADMMVEAHDRLTERF